MVRLVFPQHNFSMREGAGGTEIFDALRKRWVKLSPEEWVRQNMVQYLLQEKSYPAALMGVEKEIKLGTLRKRFDLLVYDRVHQPWMLVECKAMEVPLSQDVLDQALRYHLSIPCKYIVITNGHYCFAYRTDQAALLSVDTLPDFPA